MTSKMTSKCNEPTCRSEELCGSGRKFQLSWKAKYNWIEYNVDKRRVFCSASGRSSKYIHAMLHCSIACMYLLLLP